MSDSSAVLTLVMTVEPYSLYVRQPTSANVVCELNTRSPQLCVVCSQRQPQTFTPIQLSPAMLTPAELSVAGWCIDAL